MPTFFAPSPRGLEPALEAELVALGAADVEKLDGGVRFTGDQRLCYAANLHSRIASRVLWQIGHAPYRTERDIHEAARRLPWSDWFGPDQSIRVDVSATRSPVKSLDFVTLRIKDAVCDFLRERTGRRPDVDTRQPAVRIQAFLSATHATFYLDTSGEPLFKRGYRRSAGEAPLRENLAAGILRLTGWDGRTPLLDPMCGSGTFLCEAALIATATPPGLTRRFGFEALANYDSRLWGQLKADAESRIQPARSLPIFGSDRYGDALKLARENLEALGFADAVALKQADVLEMPPPASEGILVSNPPYGVRLDDQDALAALYPKLGDALKKKYAGWTAYLLTADFRLAKLIGLSPSRRTPLFNGALECRLFELRLVSGSMRRKPPS